MELDYIEDINEFGDSVVRLYNFTPAEATQLRDLIQHTIIEQQQRLNLSTIDFIHPRNCNVILVPYKTDEGMLPADDTTFYCALKVTTYQQMIQLLEPFCQKSSQRHQYLYDLDHPIDFLLAPAGTW
jgi:hypothetical protein